MMLCVMDVMGPGCSAAWWQAARHLLHWKTNWQRFVFILPQPLLDLCGEAGPIVILDGTQAGHTM